MMSSASGTLSRLLLLASLAIALAGCPQTAPPVHGDAAPTAHPVMPAPAPPVRHKPAPRMASPLPAQVVPQPVKLDYSCRADSDCAVKNVGSCCGTYTACVNKGSPADPDAVRAQCAKEGRVSSCAIRNITHCGCQQGRCAPQERAPVGGWLDDPPLAPDPVR
jgi:hypothetical protein